MLCVGALGVMEKGSAVVAGVVSARRSMDDVCVEGLRKLPRVLRLAGVGIERTT